MPLMVDRHNLMLFYSWRVPYTWPRFIRTSNFYSAKTLLRFLFWGLSSYFVPELLYDEVPFFLETGPLIWSMDWFIYDRDLHHEKVKIHFKLMLHIYIPWIQLTTKFKQVVFFSRWQKSLGPKFTPLIFMGWTSWGLEAIDLLRWCKKYLYNVKI